MAIERISIGVVVERRALNNPWADHAWLPVAILPGAPVAAPWTLLGEAHGVRRYYAGIHELGLYSSDTGNLLDNLLSGAPKVWVSLRPADGEPGIMVVGVAADPAEGEAYTETVGDIVETLPMPAQIAARVAAFVQANHAERPFHKRKRDRANPEALARRRPGRDEPEQGE